MASVLGEEPFVHNHRQVFLNGCINPIELIEYRSEHYHSELYTQFEIRKPTSIKQWIPKRQAQFLAGRIAAKKSLAFNHIPTIKTQVGIGHSREPIWPEACLGSISHTSETSIACTSGQGQFCAGLGVDIQETIAIDLQTQISPTILTHTDSVLLSQGFSNLTESDLFTLIFSAKESFFKAAFNSVGQYFDFIDVSIIDLDIAKQQLTLITNKNLSPTLPKGFETNISYTLLESPTARVITACHWEL